MFWAIDNDDYLGNCHGETFPIIKAAKKALNERLRYAILLIYILYSTIVSY